MFEDITLRLIFGDGLIKLGFDDGDGVSGDFDCFSLAMVIDTSS